MSIKNPLWGALRIHGELLKLGLRSRSRAPPSTWSNGVDRQAKDGAPFECNGETTQGTVNFLLLAKKLDEYLAQPPICRVLMKALVPEEFAVVSRELRRWLHYF